MKKLIVSAGILLIVISVFVCYGVFGLSKYWQVLIGLTILLVLLIELQMLGWTAKKQGIITKVTFLVALVSNLFLAFVFILKVSLISLKPFLVLACVLSILSLLYGLFFYQAKKEASN